MKRKYKKKLWGRIRQGKELLKNFIDIDDVISPEGRRPFVDVNDIDVSVRFTPPHPDIPDRERPTWDDTIKIGNAKWSMADLDYVDCEDIDYCDAGIKFYRGTYYYTAAAAKRVVDQLDGWHIPTAGEWLDAKEHALFEPRDFELDFNPSTEARHTRKLTMLLGMLPLGKFDSMFPYCDEPMDFGEMAYYHAGNGSMVMFSSSLSVISTWALSSWNPNGKYMPIRLVKDN